MTEKARGNNLQQGGRQEIADRLIIEQTVQFLRIDWHHDRQVQSLYNGHSLSAARLKAYNTPHCDKKMRSRRCPMENPLQCLPFMSFQPERPSASAARIKGKFRKCVCDFGPIFDLIASDKTFRSDLNSTLEPK